MIHKSVLQSRQPDAELICARVDESETGRDALPEGQNQLTFTKNGTGDYTLTCVQPSKRVLVVCGLAALTANLQASIVSATASAVRIAWTDNAGAAANTDFHISLLRNDFRDQH